MINHNKVQIIFFVFSLACLVSCQSINLVGSVETEEFEKNCYEISLDSFIYPLNYCSDERACYGIQAYSKEPNIYMPSSQEELENNKIYWNKMLDDHARVSGFDKTRYVGTVSSSTAFKISRIEHNSRPTFGSFWTVVGILTEGQYKGLTIRFSDQLSLLPPSWVARSSFQEGPVWESRFINITKPIHCRDNF